MKPSLPVDNRFGILASALSDEVREAVRLATAGGFGGVMFEGVGRGLHLPSLSSSGRRELRRLVAASNQQLIGLRVDLGPKGLGPGADVDRCLARLGGLMEAAAGLEARLLCVQLGPLPPPPPQPPRQRSPITAEQAGKLVLPTFSTTMPVQDSVAPSGPAPAVDSAFASQVEAALLEAGAMADRYGVSVAFSSELASFAALEQVLRRANCPWFGVELCPVALLEDAWSMDEVFSRLGAEVRHVRARDAVRGAERRTQPAVIGKGDVDWPALLSGLEESGYRGWLTLDPLELADRRGAAAAGLGHLKVAAK